MQKPGRAPLKNKNFEALTNGTPLREENDKEKKTGEAKGKDSKNKLDKGGNYKVNKKDGTKYTSTPGGRKFDADAASGTLASELTKNVTYDPATKSYSPKSYESKMPSKQPKESTRKMAKQGNPYARREMATFRKDSTDYMSMAKRDAKNFNIRSKRGQGNI